MPSPTSLVKAARFVATHPLNRGKRAGALWRFLKWQIGSRLVPGPVLFPFVNETTLLAAPGLSAANGNLYVGLFEYPEMAFVLHSLRPSELFVDVGANIGSYTTLAACAGARCISLEPGATAFAYLQRNVAINRAEAKIWRVVVGNDRGRVRFTTGMGSINHVAKHREDVASEEMEMLPLDEILGDEHPTVLKIDVEGFESAVIAGASATLAKRSLKAVVMEQLGHGLAYGFDEREIAGRMSMNGFKAYSYSPANRLLREFDGTAKNAIYLRDVDEMQERVKSAPRFRVHGTDV